ncbi:MAG TPA: metal-dependent transcriptional regulator [Symbiobacteriaceae bacterium]|nr:metal-dependent transcriptional regulator [Symbiobacteriaceae bacterium]
MVSHAMEDYVATVWRLTRRGGVATTSEVARRLGVTPASTSYMFRKMAEAGLVEYKEYAGAALTPAGETAAMGYIRRHRVTERFLVDVLGIGWDRADALADQMEHALPDEVIDRMDAVLGHPVACPHGYPIPSKEGVLPERHLKELHQLAPGETARVGQVAEDDPGLLAQFGRHGLKPGATLTVTGRDGATGTLTLQVEGLPDPVVLTSANAARVRVHASKS